MKNKIVGLVIFCSVFHPGINCQEFVQVLKDVGPDRTENKHFGNEVDMFGNYAVVGSFQANTDLGGDDSIGFTGAAYMYERDTYGDWNFVQKLMASDRDSIDYFGGSVAIWNNYLVIGAPREEDDVLGDHKIDGAGSAYIFRRQHNGEWVETQKIVASDRDSDDYFGSHVAIWGDYLAVAATHDEHDTTGGDELNNAGSVYIFNRDEHGVWQETKKIVASERGVSYEFGNALSMDEQTLIIGSARENAEDLIGAGAVYVYERDAMVGWKERVKLVADVRGYWEFFGFSVDVSGDLIAIGSPYDNENELDEDSVYRAGSLSIFKKADDGNWIFDQKLVAPVRAAKDYLGQCVSISGNCVVAGATGEDEYTGAEDSLDWAGAVFLFRPDEAGIWELDSKIVPEDRAADEYLGENIVISYDYLMVGSDWDDKDQYGENELNNSGSVYFFESCHPQSAEDPENIIDNGDYENCMLVPWWVYTSDEQDQPGTFILDSGSCMVWPQDTAAIPDPLHMQLIQQFTPAQESRIEPGSVYELSFDAKATVKDRPCLVWFGTDEEPYNDILAQEVYIDTLMTSYNIDIPVYGPMSSIRLAFGLGTDLSRVWLDNIHLVYAGEVSSNDEELLTLPVFPNPAVNYLHIRKEGLERIELYTASGRLIRRENAATDELDLNMQGLPGGIYIVNLVHEQGSSVYRIVHREGIKD